MKRPTAGVRRWRPALANSAGVPWSAAYLDTIGEPTADLCTNIAAEAQAKIVYERLMNLTDDPGISKTLGFLMTREIALQKSFEKRCIQFSQTSRKVSVPACRNLQRFATTCRKAINRREVPGTKGPVGNMLRHPNQRSTVAMGWHP